MSMEFDIVRLGKMLDRAGHPGTPEHERVVSVSKAYAYCSAHGRTFAAVADNINVEAYIEVSKMPNRHLHDQIAELSIARDDDAERIRELEERLSALAASNDRLREERDAFQARADQLDLDLAELRKDDVRRHRSDRDVGETIAERQEAIDERPDDQAVAAPVEIPRPTIDPVVEPEELTSAEWKKFEKLAAAGYAKADIARTLTRMLGRSVPIACVSRLMRIRWSPRSGQRFALWKVRASPA